MRLFFLFILPLLLAAGGVRAQHRDPAVRFRLSHPYGLFHFMQACDGIRATSGALVDLIEREGLQQDSGFAPLIARWRAIRLDYSYTRDQYPEQRLRSRQGTVEDLLISAAVQSNDLAGFRERTIGTLPNVDHEALFAVLEAARPTYERLVWQPCLEAATTQVDSMNRYAPRISALFGQLAGLYGTTWPSDIPFIVTLYPVPGQRGGTGATPHNNILCVGMLSGDRDYDGVAGVVMHEMCHTLYNEQPAALQERLERYFLADTSRYAPLAYTFFDEGMATAGGNGWAHEALHGTRDTGAWYANRYINGFGHALYPQVAAYLAAGRSLDSAFIGEAIRLFAQTFPDAPYEYALLLNNISLYSDAPNDSVRAEIFRTLRRHFRVSAYNASAPLLDPGSLDLLQHNTATQLVVIAPDATAGLARLRKLFPPFAAALRGKPAGQPYVVSFFDAARRPVIIVCASNMTELDGALASLEKQVRMALSPQYRQL